MPGEHTKSTLIHESLHYYSNDIFKDYFGKDMDEGTTELFARDVMAEVEERLSTKTNQLDLRSERGKVYAHEVALVREVIRIIGRNEMMEAYFRGDVGPFRQLALTETQSQTKDALKKAWDDFIRPKGGIGEFPTFWRQLYKV